jgi:hypothetical protein
MKKLWTAGTLVRAPMLLGVLKNIDLRIVVMTLLNALLCWPWHSLRVAFDSGYHYPKIVFGMTIVTLWVWYELGKALIVRFSDLSRHTRSNDPGTD